MSPEAFCDFYRIVLPDVYGYVLRLCAGDRAQAEDLTQDVFVALVEELHRGRLERADVRWLITVARSRFLDLARRQRRRGAKWELIQRDDGADDEPTGTDVLCCLAKLQPLHRAVLVLRYVDGLTVADVATVVGRSRGAGRRRNNPQWRDASRRARARSDGCVREGTRGAAQLNRASTRLRDRRERLHRHKPPCRRSARRALLARRADLTFRLSTQQLAASLIRWRSSAAIGSRRSQSHLADLHARSRTPTGAYGIAELTTR